jgi:CRISPR-associated endonuclease/helicase Cas3
MAHLEIIPPILKPKFLDHLKAKSPSKGGDTLAQHTWAVLCRLADQYRLRGSQMMDDRWWHQLYWGCFLHDFGKAATGFQERLLETPVPNRWAEGQHRHEVLSLGFVDALFPAHHPDRAIIIGVVASHHRDAETILERYGGRNPQTEQQQRVEFLVSQLHPNDLPLLWRWLTEYAIPWADGLGIPVLDMPPFQEQAITADHIRRTLADFSSLYTQFEDGEVLENSWSHRLSRGLILTADHAASAGSAAFPPIPPDLNDRIHRAVTAKGTPRPHQTAAAQAELKSAILISPTGSGKTEAALLWVQRQMALQPAPRVFYTLPYQASMNAMADRLATDLFGTHLTDPDNRTIAIQHSRATLKYYQEMMESEDAPAARKVAQQAKELKSRAKLNWYPIQVFSPYQMLKAAFAIKGYEAQLVDYSRALFILDEIHAYDPHKLALILETIGWLRENLQARFLVMTATLPPIIQEKLCAVLGDPQIIEASPEQYQQSQRHTVHLHEGELLDQVELPYADWKAGHSVLICCNTIKRAQQVYEQLKQKGLRQEQDVLLLHGRFNGLDRNHHEAMLMERVATQVVEVSLNIDLDTLYTEPAPLEALLQRFGRVNRGRGKDAPLCPVNVFTEPVAEKETLPYDHRLVGAALTVLQERSGGQAFAIDEAQVTNMLEAIYQDEGIRTRWEKYYGTAAQSMRQQLAALVPYQSAADDLKREFYRLFDGTQVIPTACWDDYIQAKDAGGWLAASQYLVNMSWGQYKMWESRIKKREDKELADHIDMPYDSEYGLRLDEDTDE